MKIAFIVNPHAGIKQNAFQVTERDTRLLLKHHEVVLHKTTGPHDATRAARQFATEKYDIVVAVGGDGTANETALGLIGSETAFCLLPYGSGNGIARGLKLPMNPKKIIEQLPHYKKHRHDVWQLWDGDQIRHFFGFAGVGFDAFVGYLFNRRKGRRGLWAYVYLVMTAYRKYQPIELRIKTNNREFTAVPFLFAVGNTNEYGNGARIAPDAIPDDGLLDVTMMKSMTFARGVLNGWKLFTGSVAHVKDVELERCHELSIKPTAKVFYHTDGEPYETDNEIRIRKHTGELTVLHL